MSDMTLKAMLLGEDKSMSKSFTGAGKAAQTASKDVGGASRGIKGHVHGLSGALRGDFSGITSSLVGGISMIGPWGAAAGGVLAGLAAATGVLGKFASESIDAFKDVAGQTLTLQRIMGGTPEEASRMRFAFKETGVDAEAGGKALGIFSKNIVGFGGKTGAAIPILKQFGINAKDTHGHLKPMADLLPDIADKFAKMPNGAEKSALALKLFGKGGLTLLPFLNRGKDGLDKLKESSDKFGLTLSGKDLDALKKSRAAHKEWDAAMEGAKVRIGAQLLPMVTKLVLYFQTKMIPIIITAGKWVSDHRVQIEKTATAIGKAIVIMVKAWVNWLTIVTTVVKAIATVFGWLWNSALKPVITFILVGFAAVASMIGHVLLALGKIPGFGWAKTAGLAMLGAAKAAATLALNINTIPANKTVTVNTYFKTHGAPNPGSVVGSGAGYKGYATGGRPAMGKVSIVGEHGPEFFVPDSAGTIYTKQQAAAMAGSGGSSSGGGGGIHVHINGNTLGTPDTIAAQIYEALRRYGSRRGGTLGLA